VGAIEDRTLRRHSPSDAERGETYEQLARKIAQQGAVAELGRLALLGLDVPELFETALSFAAAGLKTDLAAILQPDEDTGVLTCRAKVGWRDEMIQPVEPTLDSQVGATFLKQEHIIVDDLASDERFPGSRHLLELGLTSAISVVIRGDERPRGVLVTHSRRARTFDHDDILFLRGIANVIAAAAAQTEAKQARARSDERLRFLAKTSHALASSLDPGWTMEELARLVVPQLADWCVVHVVDGDRLLPLALAHPDPDRTAEARAMQQETSIQLADESVPLEVIRSGRSRFEPVIDDDLLQRIARDDDHLARLRAAQLCSGMVVPLVGRGETVGTITFVWAESGGRYDEADLSLAEELGRRAGIAIDNARTHQAERRAHERADRLQRVTARLAAALTPEEVYEAVLGEGIASCDARSGLLALLDPTGEHLEVVAHSGYDAALMEAWRRFPVAGDYPLSEAVRERSGVFCETAEERDRRFPEMGQLELPNHALVCLPLPGSDRLLGGIVLGFPAPRTLDEAERAFLSAVATQSGQALERAQLASALAREREQFATVLEQMPSGVVIAEAPSGRIILGNRQLETIWGAPPAGTEPVPSYDAFRGHREDGTPFGPDEWPLARALHGEMVVNEPVLLARAGGESAIASTSAAPVRNAAGEIVAAVAVFSDMSAEYTARREAERRADAARALAFVADGVCLVDTDGIVRLWNGAAAQATGLAEGAVVGRRLTDALRGWEAVARDVPTATAGSGPFRPSTFPFELPAGERWLSIAGVAFDEGVVYAFQDVTEERRLDAMKSDFIATVSHELRTPLAAIYGAAATLRQRRNLDPEEQQLFLAMITEQAERLAGIVNEILVASRIESGLLPVTVATVDPVEVARQALDAARGIDEDFEYALLAEPGLPPVRADADRLRQVLGNLLENARKYSDGSARAELQVGRSGGSVQFVVRDFGIGIPRGDEERIFEKFYRVDAAMASGVSGTGLGLYIVRELVQRMDGRVSVDSTPGEGSSFVVELPAAA
jgi:signal transduction histidine kinase/GAF domain-containing protein